MQVSLELFQEQVSALRTPEMPDPASRYAALANLDPYPQIPPALLHSGHIASYAISTGMIEPFDIDALQKPATYLVPLEGAVRYRDEDGKPQSFYLAGRPVENEIEVRRELVLKPNSLTYVTLEPTFRIPPYLAGRFNLLIRDVYRGLLVGTGPLVDPGFVGRLSIPLHNFTSNEYILRAGEGFVYFEFTKLSWSNPEPMPAVPGWVPAPVTVQPPFPSSKGKRKSLDDYIDQATGNGPAQNAIHNQIKRVSDTANEVTRRIRFFSFSGAVALAALVITTLAALMTGYQVYLGAQQFTLASQTNVSSAAERLGEQVRRLEQNLEEARRVMQELQDRPSGRTP